MSRYGENGGRAAADIAVRAPAGVGGPLRVEVIEDVGRFRALRDEWTALLERSAADGLFLTWEWLFTWWRHLSGGARLHVLAVWSDGEMVGLAPLLLRRRRALEAPFPVLEFLGGTAGSDYLDLVLRSGSESQAVDALADYLGAEKLALRLTQVRPGSSAAVLAAELERRGWWLDAVSTEVCPLVTWPAPSWDSYLATLTSKDRVDFRRRLNNLSKQFEVRFEQAETEEGRRETLRALFALHDSRWRERGGSTALHTPALRSFHDEVTALALTRGWLRLYLLVLDGQPVAAQYSFRYRGTFYDYQKGFDPSYGRHGIGLITVGLTIKRAIEEGAAEYDFLHGAEPYKFRWAGQVRELSRLELFPPGARGATYRLLVAGGSKARKAVRKVVGDVLADRLTGRRG